MGEGQISKVPSLPRIIFSQSMSILSAAKVAWQNKTAIFEYTLYVGFLPDIFVQ